MYGSTSGPLRRPGGFGFDTLAGYAANPESSQATENLTESIFDTDALGQFLPKPVLKNRETSTPTQYVGLTMNTAIGSELHNALRHDRDTQIDDKQRRSLNSPKLAATDRCRVNYVSNVTGLTAIHRRLA